MRLWFIEVDIIDYNDNNVVTKKVIDKVRFLKFWSNVSIFSVALYNGRKCTLLSIFI
jgi:hypothetical protein